MNRDTRRTRALLFLLLLTSITLITVDHRGGDDSPLAGLRSFAAAVFGPVEKAAAAIPRPRPPPVDPAVRPLRGGGRVRPGGEGVRGDRRPGQRYGRPGR